MKPILILLLAFSCGLANAQMHVDTDKFEGNALTFLTVVNGQPMLSARFTRLVEGTPYFTDQWMKGAVIMDQGGQYKNLQLRVNILDATLEFQDPKGNMMTCSSPVRQVVLTDSFVGSQFIFEHASFLPSGADIRRNSWVQLLSAGKSVSLYKSTKKQINELRPYNSATTEQRIVSINYFFVLVNDQWIKIKKTSDIPDILAGKKKELTDFIKAKQLNSKEEKDIVQVIQYYNSL